MSSQGTGTGGQRMFEFTCTAVPAVENTCRRAGASDSVWDFNWAVRLTVSAPRSGSSCLLTWAGA